MHRINHEKLQSNINNITRSKVLLEKEFSVVKNKKEKEEKDFIILHNKKEDTKQKLEEIQGLLDDITGGDDTKTRYYLMSFIIILTRSW